MVTPLLLVAALSGIERVVWSGSSVIQMLDGLRTSDLAGGFLFYVDAASRSPSPFFPSCAEPLLLGDPDRFIAAFNALRSPSRPYVDPSVEWIAARIDPLNWYKAWHEIIADTFTPLLEWSRHAAV